MWQKTGTQKLGKRKKIIELWQNSKTQNVTSFKDSNCDKTQKLKMWQKFKSQNVTKKIKMWWKSKKLKCDKTQKLKMWQN